MISITVNMMGIFQDYFSKSFVVNIPEGTTLNSFKDFLIIKFSNESSCNFSYLITKSVFSNNSNILLDDYVLSNNEVIYLLPPFSGG